MHREKTRLTVYLVTVDSQTEEQKQTSARPDFALRCAHLASVRSVVCALIPAPCQPSICSSKPSRVTVVVRARASTTRILFIIKIRFIQLILYEWVEWVGNFELVIEPFSFDIPALRSGENCVPTS